MELYDAIYKRRIVSDFKNQIVPDDILVKCSFLSRLICTAR